MVRLLAMVEGCPATLPPSVESVAKECNIQSPPRRILVVDDNEDSAESLAQLLEFNGHRVERAHDGLGALDAVAQFDPDVVLLDVGLPKMDGYEVCQAIRRNKSRRRPLVIALTGWGQDNDRRKSMEAGFDHHLVKPVSFDVVMQLLTRLSANENALASLGS